MKLATINIFIRPHICNLQNNPLIYIYVNKKNVSIIKGVEDK
jgi:hypothetical protein